MIAATVWTVTAAIGLLISLWALHEAWSDYQLAKRAHLDGLAQYDTKADLWQEVMTTCAFIVALFVGLVRVIPIEDLVWVLRYGLISLLVILVVMTLRRRLNRRELLRRVGLRPKGSG